MGQVNNPYSDFIGMMHQCGAAVNTPGISFGVIKSLEPLIVTIGGLDLDEDFVQLADHLKPQIRQGRLEGNFDIKGTWHPSISTSDNHSHTSTLTEVNGIGTFQGTIYWDDYGIKIGDTGVAVCTDDKQKYIIIGKVAL